MHIRQAWLGRINSNQLSQSFNTSLKDYLKLDLNVA